MTDALLESIYEGPLESSPWLTFVRQLRARYGAVAAGLVLRRPEPEQEGFVVADSDWDVATLRRQYQGHYYSDDPFLRRELPPGRAFRWSDIVEMTTFRRSSYYREYCRPRGFDYAVCLGVEERRGSHAWINMSRPQAAGDFDTCDLEELESLAPHLERALALFARLRDAELQKTPYMEAIDGLSIGILVLDRHGNLLHANDEARVMLADTPVCRLDQGRLALRNRTEQQAFDAALATVAADPGGQRVEALSLGGVGSASLGVLIRGFPEASGYAGEQPPATIVYMTNPVDHRLTPQRLVARLFGLTDAEARVATLLADGMTPADVAEHIGISEGTARLHCKRILRKTGAARQAELVSLIFKSVAPLASRPALENELNPPRN